MAQRSANAARRHGTDRPNTLNLHAAGVERLVSRLDEAAGEGRNARHAKFRRSYVRMPFRLEGVQVRFMHPGGSMSELRLASRNLSSGGIALLHNRFVHVGTAVMVVLPTQDGGTLEVRGVVRRCVHLSTVVHEIGVQFEKKIDARQFMPADQKSAFFSLEKVDPKRVRGCVVLVEQGELDLQIFKHLLRHTEVRIRVAPSTEAAIPIIEEGCDLVAVDVSDVEGDFEGFMARLREQGVLTPVIAIVADAGPDLKKRLSECRVNAILSKPLTEGKLLQALAEFMLSEADDAPQDQGADEAADPALVQGFVEELQQYADRLAAALRAEQADKCRSLAAQIKGTAPVLGFHSLARLAGNAVERLEATASTHESTAAIEDLIVACRRAERNAAA